MAGPYEIRGEAGPELVIPLPRRLRIASPLCAIPAPVGEEPAMAKIGTAHVEIKPVLNEEALEAVVVRIEEAIAEGIERALAKHGSDG